MLILSLSMFSQDLSPFSSSTDHEWVKITPVMTLGDLRSAMPLPSSLHPTGDRARTDRDGLPNFTRNRSAEGTGGGPSADTILLTRDKRD